MRTLAQVLVGLLAFVHVYILVLEMFLWDTPRGRKIFGLDAEFAAKSKQLAANQGLYNGFLAAGLVWGLVSSDFRVQVFFAACVLVAGLYGGITTLRRILYVQAVPALVTLVALFLAR